MNSRHSTIRISPDLAERKENHVFVRENLEKYYSKLKKNREIKFKVNDLVRIGFSKRHFSRGYNVQAKHEIFRICEVITKYPRVLYKLESLSKEQIKGNFYQEQLQLCKNQNTFLIEKIIKRKGSKCLVKWMDYDEVSWVPISEIEKIQDIEQT